MTRETIFEQVFTYTRTLSSWEKKPRKQNQGLNGKQSRDICDTGAMLHQPSYQANWEFVILLIQGNEGMREICTPWGYVGQLMEMTAIFSAIIFFLCFNFICTLFSIPTANCVTVKVLNKNVSIFVFFFPCIKKRKK